MFNINFITIFGNDAQVQVAAVEKVPVVSFHWGHPPGAQVALLKEAGCSIWLQVSSVADAETAIGYGAEVIIAQGQEAGTQLSRRRWGRTGRHRWQRPIPCYGRCDCRARAFACGGWYC